MTGRWIVLTVIGITAAGAAIARGGAGVAARAAAADRVSLRNGSQQRFWRGGQLQSSVTYRDDAYDGEYRTYYENGAPYELRHYAGGHEEGLQQSWTERGVLYLNYEVHNGRRFGLVNPSPCNTVGDNDAPTPPAEPSAVGGSARVRVSAEALEADGSGLPYYGDAAFTPHWSPVSHRVAPFELQTQTGAVVSDVALSGRPYVASFIYTQCAAVCPLLVRQLSRVQAAAAAAGGRIVSFSVTPDTDTPAVLAQFGRDRGIDPRVWLLVTGRKRTIYQLARSSFFADDNRAGGAMGDETDFLHTEKLVLVDGTGHVRGVYNGTQPHAVDQLTGDLARLSAGGTMR